MQDPYFKVRAHACTAISQLSSVEAGLSPQDFEKLSEQVLPVLVKLLRDGQLNKQIVAETIVLMGARGEQTLVSILDIEPVANHKFRTCIVRALALSDV